MLLTDVEVHEANSLEQASGLLAQYAPDVRVMAGGTDLLVDLKTDRYQVSHIVSVGRIASLRGVTTTERGVHIGALTTPNQLTATPVIREKLAAILDATTEMAAPQIRNMGTVGGNVAGAVPSADLPPVLMVLNGRAILWSPQGKREVPLESFFVGPRKTVLRADELLTEIFVPFPQARFGAAYQRLGLREANACPVAGVAASLILDDKKIIREARICLGAVAPTPVLARSVAASLIGKAADETVFENAGKIASQEAKPISDIRGSAEYRTAILSILTRRALTMALQRTR